MTAACNAVIWKERTDARGALAGIRVVDLSRVLAGPLCTQMMADHGADVIKVEPPFGDESRLLGPPFDDQGTAAYYSALNRGKRAISLDLSTAEGRETVENLLQDADVLVENFLPGTMERWGLGFEDHLSKRFPRLIYCAISGFGDSGPLGGLPGYDAVLQAICGLMSINGTTESGPTRVGVPIVDHLTGYTAFSGISMALLERERSGRAQRVDAVLFDAALSLLVPHAANWLHSGKTPTLTGSAHPNIAPYDVFQASDGPVFLSILNESQFRRFCKFIDQPHLAEAPTFNSNAARLKHRQELKTIIEQAFASRTREALCESLMRLSIPAGPVNTVPEALRQSHTNHRNMLVQRSGYSGLGVPIKLSSTPGLPGVNPPGFAEHNATILPCKETEVN